MNKDNFFVPVANTKPYFKAAFEGFAGTGKTYTAAKIAVGIHKRIGLTWIPNFRHLVEVDIIKR